jgi:hypothetical protein
VPANVARVSDEALQVSSLQPISASEKLHIIDAHLLRANLSNSHIHSASEVDTRLLVVHGTAEFLSEVVIDGGVTVHGSVVGSGPYVDSSDRRFKRNITAMGAFAHGSAAAASAAAASAASLNVVMKMQGVRKSCVTPTNLLLFMCMFFVFACVCKCIQVTYKYAVDAFPERKFPDGEQIGWIAQDMQEIAPQLVSADSEGYLGVSYAHATVLVAEAVKELKLQHDAEIGTLKSEIEELKKLVAQLSSVFVQTATSSTK